MGKRHYLCVLLSYNLDSYLLSFDVRGEGTPEYLYMSDDAEEIS